MSKTVADVMKMVKENEVKFVDFRFTDTRGKEQHVTVPVSAFDEDKFTAGHAFDGSSIAGWKGIEASDMLLMPDPNTANIDPFYEEPTLLLTLRRDRARRRQALRARPALAGASAPRRTSSRRGIGDAAYFGPEPEFFIFDQVRWNVDMSGCFVKIDSEEAPWSQRREDRGRQHGPPAGRQGRLLPGAAGRQHAGHPLRDVPDPRVAGRAGRGAPPRGRRHRARTSSAPSSRRWCSAPTGCSCRST